MANLLAKSFDYDFTPYFTSNNNNNQDNLDNQDNNNQNK